MSYRLLLYGLCLMLLAGCNLGGASPDSSVTAAPGMPRLMVAWVESGNLIVWQQGDTAPRQIASGGVIRPYIAPDGQHIAFTRGPNGSPDTLWVVDVNGTAEQKLVGDSRPPRYREGDMQIGDAAWFDERVLYFNTLEKVTPAFHPVNDLYRINIRTREVALLMNPGEGGRIHISPDKQHLALVASGTYGEQDGRIRVIDPLAQDEPRDLLYFVGVATGSHYAFYPPIAWLPYNNAVLTAIPDKDLLYSETDTADSVPLTAIWRLPIESPSQRNRIAELRVSFFGLPRWSDDGSLITFLQRTAKTNEFSVMLANQSGENAVNIASAQAGQIEQPQWIPGTTQFVYPLDTGGTVYLSGLDTESVKLSDEAVFSPLFVSSDVYLFATPAGDSVQIRSARIGEDSALIGTTARIPVFDARMVEAS